MPEKPTSAAAGAFLRALANDLVILIAAGTAGYFLPSTLPSMPDSVLSAVSAVFTVLFTIPLLVAVPTSVMKLLLVTSVRTARSAPASNGMEEDSAPDPATAAPNA